MEHVLYYFRVRDQVSGKQRRAIRLGRNFTPPFLQHDSPSGAPPGAPVKMRRHKAGSAPEGAHQGRPALDNELVKE
jgi:hypothetical protein